MERPDEAFLQEARSNVRELTDGLLAVEGRHDAERIDDLFRTAHSLKGTCRTVGLADASQLAHSLEDVLSALRRGDVEATAELIDEALAAVDDLEATIEASANGQEPAVDPVATGASLRDALDEHRTETEELPEPVPDDGAADGVTDESPSEDEGLSDDVIAALEDSAEFDDIDALVAEMDDIDDDETLDAWGVLDEGGAVTADDGPTEPEPGEAPDDPTAFFESVKADVGGKADDVDDLQRDIEAVEFGEFDDDDDITIEELVEMDPTEEPTEAIFTGSADTGPRAESDQAATGGTEQDDGSEVGASADAEADEPASPSPTDPDGPGHDGTPSPPAETDEDEPTVTEPSTTEPVAAASGSEDRTTDESATDESTTDEPSIDESVTDEQSADERTAVEGGTGEPTDGIERAVEEAERSGFEFGSVRATDAADEPPADTSSDDTAVPGGSGDDPTPASADAEVGSGTDTVGDPTGEVPDPDSLPDVDLDIDEEFGEAGSSVGTEMEVELDDEMVAFESRFEGAFDEPGGRTEPDGEVGDVFRAAVTTIEESHLDGDRYGAIDSQEDVDAVSSGRLPPLTVTVDTAEQLMTIAEELSLIRHRVEEALGEEVPDFQRLITEYQRTVTDVRLMPLETAIEDIPRTVRDVVRSQGKEVDLVIEDSDVRLDRGVIDRLRDPLLHLARNAVDHGIEPPGERVAAGKPPEGRIELRTEQIGDEVVIELSDDGRGIDPDRVRESAVERGHLSQEAADEMTAQETYDLLFQAGVSTADEVTDVSGRGVGMDVVGHRVTSLDGHVEVESDPGRGTTVRLVVPVSIALTEVVFVDIGDERFGVPLTGVEGVTEAPDDLEHRGFVRLEDVPSTVTPGEIDPSDDVPFIHLREALGIATGENPSRAKIVWVRTGTDLLAVGCDRVVGSREVIIRPYEDLLREVPGVQGATTLSDGRPVNVLDVGSL